jgi:hypothetical protein
MGFIQSVRNCDAFLKTPQILNMNTTRRILVQLASGFAIAVAAADARRGGFERPGALGEITAFILREAGAQKLRLRATS